MLHEYDVTWKRVIDSTWCQILMPYLTSWICKVRALKIMRINLPLYFTAIICTISRFQLHTALMSPHIWSSYRFLEQITLCATYILVWSFVVSHTVWPEINTGIKFDEIASKLYLEIWRISIFRNDSTWQPFRCRKLLLTDINFIVGVKIVKLSI